MDGQNLELNMYDVECDNINNMLFIVFIDFN